MIFLIAEPEVESSKYVLIMKTIFGQIELRFYTLSVINTFTACADSAIC